VLHKQLQRLLGLRVINMRMFQTTGQGAAHQHPRAVANPIAHLIYAR
jgi:hypothetical protein